MQDENLALLAEKAVASLDSINELLQVTNDTINKKATTDQLLASQKKALLDSFAVKKFHLHYKQWENNSRDQFIASHVTPYNYKLARMSRIYAQYESHEAKYAELSKAIRLPELKLSMETIRQYNNGELLVHLGEKDRLSQTVPLSALFSLSSESSLPEPNLEVIHELVNIEYRLRMQHQIQNEVLLRLKSHLIAKNSQWSARDSKLNQFLTQDLKKVYEEVMATRASEYEDLKYYEEDIEDESMEEENMEEEEEKEEVMEGNEAGENEEEKEGGKDEPMEEEREKEKEKEKEEKEENMEEEKEENVEEEKEENMEEKKEERGEQGFMDPDNNDDMLLE